MESQLIKEMAFTLYERELTSMGIARRFAKMSKWAFIEGLAERGLTRHYSVNELEEDINYAKNFLVPTRRRGNAVTTRQRCCS